MSLEIHVGPTLYEHLLPLSDDKLGLKNIILRALSLSMKVN
jgi:hypothetical protein